MSLFDDSGWISVFFALRFFITVLAISGILTLYLYLREMKKTSKTFKEFLDKNWVFVIVIILLIIAIYVFACYPVLCGGIK